MCNKSETIGKIASALVAFSGEVKAIEKDGNNPHFKSAYTTLDHMIDETKPLLHKNGLTVMQFPGGDGEKVTIRTMILHTSGEWIESEPLTLKAVKMDPQGAGSAITYARRYSYAAALSLSLGDDDDGNGASNRPDAHRQSQSGGQANSNQSNNRPAAQPTGQAGTSVAAVSARVYKLREEMNWGWPDLTQFASDTLQREVKYLKKDVTEMNDWLMIEKAMIATKQGYEQHQEAPFLV